jgi:methylation protein EvaC
MIIEFLDLGPQPLANNFSDKPNSPPAYELRIGFNTENKMIRTLESPPPSAIFTKTYPYNSSHSPYLVKHFENIADQIVEKYQPNKVLEIGTNSLPFLKSFSPKTSVGIEPCTNFAEYGRGLGYTIYDKFWNLDTAKEVVDQHGKFNIIYAANCMCHIPNITEAFQAVDYALSNDGFFVFEDPSMLDVLRYNSYDQFYDEHVSLFSAISLCNEIWKNTGLEIIDIEHLPLHGGSNRFYVKKKDNHLELAQESVKHNITVEAYNELDHIETYIKFAQRVEKSKDDLLEWLSFLNHNDYKIISYGATSKATTIFNYCKITSKQIQYCIDTIPTKFDKYYPGTDIIIKPYTPNWWLENNIKYAFLGAWNFHEQILYQESAYKQSGGRFLSHVPYVKLL